ncbi:HK97 gp10 family phage protein [Mammaliicoccus lentus]|uniref:HK97 gp10 family phage protein n=1 Tax=Mammaliicoccus lentus TaxID=42858 RepID=UPI002DBB91B9|nr:HK97 gp10 family phage protein [Mammaliicoccus lentus]
MAGIKFNIEWDGLRELQNEFRTMNKRFSLILLDEMDKIGLTCEDYAKALAPRDSGELEDSIHSTQARVEGRSFVVYVGTNMEYATYVHELNNVRPVGDKYERGVKYPNYYIRGRGIGTRQKPNVKGYQPGRKFLQHAVILTDKHFEQAMERALERLLEGGS